MSMLKLSIALALSAATGTFAQGTFPAKPVRIIVLFAAGAATDVLTFPEQFAAFIRADSAKWSQPIKKQNITSD